MRFNKIMASLLVGAAAYCLPTAASAQQGVGYAGGNMWALQGSGVAVNGALESALRHSAGIGIAGAVAQGRNLNTRSTYNYNQVIGSQNNVSVVGNNNSLTTSQNGTLTGNTLTQTSPSITSNNY
ncbi:MAG TPA: hypothetical protein VHP58_02275 [Alphaproteobacteria bacterium]|nr:hypothetical protein [Alphaproteobacteria bacterium]